LENTSFVDFEYSIKVVTPHPDFTLISDEQGSLPVGKTTVINFSFTPKYQATAESMIELQISEFNSAPK
jgi:hypothetical protein